jgi:hypothetical protein
MMVLDGAPTKTAARQKSDRSAFVVMKMMSLFYHDVLCGRNSIPILPEEEALCSVGLFLFFWLRGFLVSIS